MVQLTRLPIVLATAAAAIQQQGFVEGGSSIQTHGGTGICPARSFPSPFRFEGNSHLDAPTDAKSRKYEVEICPARELPLIERHFLKKNSILAMEELRHALEEILRERNQLGDESEKADNHAQGVFVKEATSDTAIFIAAFSGSLTAMLAAGLLMTRAPRQDQMTPPHFSSKEGEVAKRMLDRALHLAWAEMNDLEETNEQAFSREEWDQTLKKLKIDIETRYCKPERKNLKDGLLSLIDLFRCRNKLEKNDLKDILLSLIDLLTKLEWDREYSPANENEDIKITEGQLVNLSAYLSPMLAEDH